MPDSLPLVRKPCTGNSALSVDFKSKSAEAGAHIDIPRARHLGTPPRDVVRLLDRHGTSLPRYLDAQRWRDVAASHERWPHLWPRQPDLPGGAS